MRAAVTPLVLHIDDMVLNHAQEHFFPVPGIGRLIVEVSRSHTIRHTHTHTPGRPPLNEQSSRRRGRYPHNEHKRKSMPANGFELAIQAIERRQTYALDRKAT
jgi:hypothetical protein